MSVRVHVHVWGLQAQVSLGSGLTHLSGPSLALLFRSLRAILDLWLPLRAGPTLIDVFSNGVVEMETLFPLCVVQGRVGQLAGATGKKGSLKDHLIQLPHFTEGETEARCTQRAWVCPGMSCPWGRPPYPGSHEETGTCNSQYNSRLHPERGVLAALGLVQTTHLEGPGSHSLNMNRRGGEQGMLEELGTVASRICRAVGQMRPGFWVFS